MAEEVKKEKATKAAPKKKTVTKVIGPTEKDKKAAKKAEKVKEAVNELIDALTSSSSIEVEQAEKAKKIVAKITKKRAVEKTEEPKKEVKPKKTTTTKKSTKAAETKVEEVKEPKIKKTTTKATTKKVAEAKPVEEPKKEVKETKVEKPAPKKAEKVSKKQPKKVTLNFDNSKLSKEVFFLEKIYEQAIFDTIVADRASLRQGTHDVKNRSEVSGSGKKPWKQKGTGRARAGSLRSPVFVGGGRAFGPTPERNYTLKVNKKVRKLALKSALTMLAAEKAVAVNDLKLEGISTKEILNKLTTLKVNKLRTVLIVTNDEIVYRSARNLPNVSICKPTSLSVESLIGADVMIISKEGLEIVEGRLK
ncbi:MAG: 50S ribosomal protein L4 [Metamycoplasmataceae bacterium]